MAERSSVTEKEKSNRPLLVVSNRLPITFKMGQRGLEGHRSSGGLVSALEPVLRERGGKWVGWAGAQLPRGAKLGQKDDSYEMRAVPLTESEVTRYYHGFSNRTLWPLFHCFPGLARFHAQDWQTYEKVNRRFADATIEAGTDDSLVWVQDYHLMLAPQMVRQERLDVQLAFFLHIPFPPYDIFRLLPWSRELLNGILACDLIGFHVDHYARNFLDCVELLLRARVDRAAGRIEYGSRTVRVGAFPIGIDFDHYEQLALDGAPSDGVSGERIILGVDRLDYTKGIPERLLAYERLLELFPMHRGKVVLLQLAVPSRSQVAEYGDLKRHIDELVGRINGRFSTASWSPIRYLYTSLPPDKLATLYRDADVGFITPGRDGMNLVAKEFVACQVASPGVLLLSRLAGAAETMPEAILVNPYDTERTANALHRALTMDESERRSRLTALRRRERRYNVTWWLDRFLSATQAPASPLGQPTKADFESWLLAFIDGHRLAVFVDYDGTLVPPPEGIEPAPLRPEVRRALAAVARRRDTDVTVLSGRALQELRDLVADPRITCAGNHGVEIDGPGIAAFAHPEMAHYAERLTRLEQVLRRVAGASVKIVPQRWLLTVHLGDVSDARRKRVSERIRSLITKAGLQVRLIRNGIEARPPVVWNEGHAIHHIVRAQYGANWSEKVRIVYIGCDAPNEDAFRMLRGLGITIRVDEAVTLTAATRQLPDSNAVGALLEWLAKRPRAEAKPGPRLFLESPAGD